MRAVCLLFFHFCFIEFGNVGINTLRWFKDSTKLSWLFLELINLEVKLLTWHHLMCFYNNANDWCDQEAFLLLFKSTWKCRFHCFLLECLWVTRPTCCRLHCHFSHNVSSAGRDANFGSILIPRTQQSCMLNGWSTSVSDGCMQLGLGFSDGAQCSLPIMSLHCTDRWQGKSVKLI